MIGKKYSHYLVKNISKNDSLNFHYTAIPTDKSKRDLALPNDTNTQDLQ